MKGKEEALLKDIEYRNQLGEQKEPVIRDAQEFWQFVAKLLYYVMNLKTSIKSKVKPWIG